MIPYRLLRSDRKTVSLKVLPDGSLEVRAPRRMPERDIDRFVREHAGWAEKTRREVLETKRKAGEPYTEAELRALADEMKKKLPALLGDYADRLGVTFGRITIRCQRTRWGSCSSNGNLSFNCLLAAVPPRVLEYVVAHELCHRIEMNHSRRFWALVGSVVPDYAVCRNWLRTEGGVLLARLPGR